MTFTYDLASSDADELAVSKVRLEIGDTTQNAGVKPGGGNLSDEELAIWLAEEDDIVGRAAARACDALARLWANYVDTRLGPRSEALSQASERWKEQARTLREQYGGGSQNFSFAPSRQDGFSELADESEFGA